MPDRDSLNPVAATLLGPGESLDDLVIESQLTFTSEISVVTARDKAGNHAVFPAADNVHRNHILHLTRVPAEAPASSRAAAKDVAMAIADHTKHVGVLTVEFFLMPDGQVLVNEVAPRVHNSGHIFTDTAAVSQFEQHLRAVLGWPLAGVEPFRPGVMRNLLGEEWLDESGAGPDFTDYLQVPGARVHLYEKSPYRRGRKHGHINLIGSAVALVQSELDGAQNQD